MGGEAYLHDGFLDVVRAIAAAGIRPVMTTGGRDIGRERARSMAEAGLAMVSVSFDGEESSHDRIRAAPGSFASATAALGHLGDAGIPVAANTNVNRWNMRDLEGLYEHLRGAGIRAWQVQLTTPMGRAADRPGMLLQPWDLLDVLPRVAALKERAFDDGITLMPGNNLGYFGPEEALLRSLDRGGVDHWGGCQAGRFILGIQSDGGVKGCASLQSKSYVGGRVPDRTVAQIWGTASELSFARRRSVEGLWGFCRTCPFAEPCFGGCTFTAHALFGRPGNNPYCHYRARTLAKQGKRERLVLVEPAPGQPFDCARFDLVLEDLDAPDPGL